MEKNSQLTEEKQNDLDSYRNSVTQFLKGELHPTKFRGIRVPMGIYEQRENNTFMLRLRIPAGGGITPLQLRSLSGLSKEYGNGILHITTRQDIQLHRLALKDTPDVMQAVLKCGLTSKGGGGNTVRNITACSESGICEKEIFNVACHAKSLTDYLIKKPTSYTLPRKFKVAFSGCSQDCSLATVNDLGFIATSREVNGKKSHGFKVYVAGGMGSSSKVAHLLEEFVLENEIAFIAEAVKSLFDKNGNRRNKHKARLRFLYEKLGREEFIRLYKEELELIKKEEGASFSFKINSDISSPDEEKSNSKGDLLFSDEQTNEWANQNLTKQKQEDFYSIKIRVPLGEIQSEMAEKFATLMETFSKEGVIATHDQNFLLSWVKQEEIQDIYNGLKNINPSWTGAAITDLLCCAGSATCRLGICLSRGLSEATSNKLNNLSQKIAAKEVKINVSGCPNACGQHPIGNIGVVGAARRKGSHMAPYYMVMLGGYVEEGKTRFGKEIGFSHAKYIPSILSEFLTSYISEKEKYTDFFDYVERRGVLSMKALLEKYSSVPDYEEDKSFYSDWGSDDEFSLAGRGAGECGAGVFDMIEVDLHEGAEAASRACEIIDNKREENPAPFLYEAINRASRALLVTRGIDVVNDLEAFSCFEKEMIDGGYIENKFSRLLFMATEYKKGNLTDKPIIENRGLVKELVASVKSLYDSMDESLRFKKLGEIKTPAENQDDAKKVADKQVIPLLDLRGVACPFNYVKTKLKLEMMDVGEELEIYLDDGPPIKNVPNSLKNDGQDILKMEKTGAGYFDLIIKKRN